MVGKTEALHPAPRPWEYTDKDANNKKGVGKSPTEVGTKASGEEGKPLHGPPRTARPGGGCSRQQAAGYETEGKKSLWYKQ